MRILFINNNDCGFADHIEVAAGITVAALMQERLPNEKPQNYQIRVNRQPVAADYVLQEGDRLELHGQEHSRCVKPIEQLIA